MFGTVRRVGTFERERRELLRHGLVEHLTRSRLDGRDGTLLVEHVGDAHNFTWGWRRHG